MMGANTGGRDNVVPLMKVSAVDAVSELRPVLPTLIDALAVSDALPPDLSARSVPSRLQWAGGFLILAGVATAFYYYPALTSRTLEFAFWFAFCLVIAWRFALVVIGLGGRVMRRLRPQHHPFLPDDDLPIYTILVALRDECAMMPQLARNLSALDWPLDRLDVILLVEADDMPTRDAALAEPFPDGTRVMTVPAGRPLTKPRALNWGLAHAEGAFVAVYDAEDRPHPGQLREAAAAFNASTDQLACVQAPLVSSNSSAGWIAAHWSLEYLVQFGLYVPALSAMEHPILLGGTSNHFRRSALVMLGGWDAWNVTEDADLGVRLARLGGQTGTIQLPTYEMAPDKYGVWLSQRTRWIKGFMQTWLVSMRAPFSLIAELGFTRWFSLQLTLGGTIASAFLYGPMSIRVMIGLLYPELGVEPISFTLFLIGWVTGAFAEIIVPGRWSFSRLAAVLTRPFYWPLQTVAAVLALYGLVVKPFFWAKTPHKPDSLQDVPTCQPGSPQSDSSSFLPR